MDFSITDGYVAVNDKPQFIVSGEIQYFRLEKDTWEKHLDKLIEANCNTVSTYIPWIWHEQAKGEFDFTGATHPSRDLLSFLKLIEDKGLYFYCKIGPYIHAEVKNGGIPDRIFDDYPTIQSTDAHGKPTDNYVFYRTTSYFQPEYMKEIQTWFEAVIPILLPYKNIVSWQVDNETCYNMAWFSHQKTDNFSCDFNSHVVKNGFYQEFLADLYENDIEALNKNYHEQNNSFADVIPPRKEGETIPAQNKVFDWIGFKETYPALFSKELIERLYALGVPGPFVINEPLLAYVSSWKRYLDICKDDRWTAIMAYTHYMGGMDEDNITGHIEKVEFTKASETPLLANVEIQACNAYFLSHRNQRTSDYDFLWRLGIGAGINTLNYYWFSDGYNFLGTHHFTPELTLNSPLDKDANPRPQYETCKRVGKFLLDHPEIVTTTPVYDIAVAYDHTYAQLAKMDNSVGITKFKIGSDVSMSGSGLLDTLDYLDCRYQLINFESSFDLIESNRLIVQSEHFLSEQNQIKALQFVQNGGHLILVDSVPTKNENHEECTILFDALDINEIIPIQAGTAAYEGILLKYKESHFTSLTDIQSFDLIHNDDITIDFTTEDGSVVGYSKPYGSGKISVIGFLPKLFFDVTKDIYADYFQSPTTKLLTVLKRASESIEFTTVLNYSDQAQSYTFHDVDYEIPTREGLFLLKNGDSVYTCRD